MGGRGLAQQAELPPTLVAGPRSVLTSAKSRQRRFPFGGAPQPHERRAERVQGREVGTVARKRRPRRSGGLLVAAAAHVQLRPPSVREGIGRLDESGGGQLGKRLVVPP